VGGGGGISGGVWWWVLLGGKGGGFGRERGGGVVVNSLGLSEKEKGKLQAHQTPLHSKKERDTKGTEAGKKKGNKKDVLGEDLKTQKKKNAGLTTLKRKIQ